MRDHLGRNDGHKRHLQPLLTKTLGHCRILSSCILNLRTSRSAGNSIAAQHVCKAVFGTLRGALSRAQVVHPEFGDFSRAKRPSSDGARRVGPVSGSVHQESVVGCSYDSLGMRVLGGAPHASCEIIIRVVAEAFPFVEISWS
jgi:hypothetical protein